MSFCTDITIFSLKFTIIFATLYWDFAFLLCRTISWKPLTRIKHILNVKDKTFLVQWRWWNSGFSSVIASMMQWPAEIQFKGCEFYWFYNKRVFGAKLIQISGLYFSFTKVTWIDLFINETFFCKLLQKGDWNNCKQNLCLLDSNTFWCHNLSSFPSS